MHKVLVLGSGGREHTLSWKLAQSPLCEELFIAPGNAGTAMLGKNLDVDIMDFEEVKKVVDTHNIDYLIVGPEAPLVKGIYDFFASHRVKVIGPSQVASQLEGSKAFAKEFMSSFNIPTAAYLEVTKKNLKKGLKHIEKTKGKIVLKADGLAAGKGVLILDKKKKAKKALKEMLQGKFGDASKKVVIEEFLDGIEFSVFVLTDGDSYKILPVAKDYKRIGEGDTGLNTGGMGAVSPVPFMNKKLMRKVKDEVIEPTMEGLRILEYDYKGFIFLGLILVKGEPYVIEYNCRLGDPETEVVIPRLENDLMQLFVSVHNGTLNDQRIKIKKKTAATVMAVSGGYPEAYEKGKTIYIEKNIKDSLVFHAGTKMNGSDLVTNGGRVLAVTSFAKNHKKAVKKSKRNLKKIDFQGMYYRKDIGFDL